MLTRFFYERLHTFCMLGELESVLHGNRMLVSQKKSNQYGISMLLRIRFGFTWNPHVACFSFDFLDVYMGNPY